MKKPFFIIGIIILLAINLIYLFFKSYQNNAFYTLSYTKISSDNARQLYLDSTGTKLFVIGTQNIASYNLNTSTVTAINTQQYKGLSTFPHVATYVDNKMYFIDGINLYDLESASISKQTLKLVNCKDAFTVTVGAVIGIEQNSLGSYGNTLFITYPNNPNQSIRYDCVNAYEKFKDLQNKKDLVTQVWTELDPTAAINKNDVLAITENNTFCFSDWCPQKFKVSIFGHNISFTNNDSGYFPITSTSTSITDKFGCLYLTLPSLNVGFKKIDSGLYRFCKK